MIGMNVRMAPYSVPTSSLLSCNVSTHQQVWLLRRELSEQELAELLSITSMTKHWHDGLTHVLYS